MSNSGWLIEVILSKLSGYSTVFGYTINFDKVIKSPITVIPAQAEIQKRLKLIDADQLRHGDKAIFRLFATQSILYLQTKEHYM